MEIDPYTFLENAELRYLTYGSSCLTFVCKGESPLIGINDEPITDFLLNLVLINDHDDYIDVKDGITIYSEKEIYFNEEVKIQEDIYKRSLENNDQLCPAVIFSDVFKNDSRKEIIGKILSRLSKDEEDEATASITYYLPKLINSVNLAKIEGYALLCMEYAVGFSNIPAKPKDSGIDKSSFLIRTMAMYTLIKLACFYGYAHGDFHGGNLLYNPNISYFSNIPGKIILIDFGLTTKIDSNTQTIINRLFIEKNYFEIITRLCNIKRPRNFGKPTDKIHKMMYRWVCQANPSRGVDPQAVIDINNRVLELFDEKDLNIELECPLDSDSCMPSFSFSNFFSRRGGKRRTRRRKTRKHKRGKGKR